MNEELDSAKSIDSLMPPIPPPPGAPEKPAAPRSFNLERLTKQVTVFVTVMVIVCGGTLLWMSRDDLRDGANSARKRTSNPLDLVLWMGGSDKSLEDMSLEMREDERFRWEEMSAGSEFEGIDFENLPDWSENPIVPLYDPEE